jgi:hypothetical protein
MGIRDILSKHKPMDVNVSLMSWMLGFPLERVVESWGGVRFFCHQRTLCCPTLGAAVTSPREGLPSRVLSLPWGLRALVTQDWSLPGIPHQNMPSLDLCWAQGLKKEAGGYLLLESPTLKPGVQYLEGERSIYSYRNDRNDSDPLQAIPLDSF